MVVTVNYSDKLIQAYKAGASAQAMFALKMGPKPDPEAWLAEANRRTPTVARL